jgi:hypothetical protein
VITTGKVMDVLEACAERNQTGKRFHMLLKIYHDHFEACMEEFSGSDKSSSSLRDQTRGKAKLEDFPFVSPQGDTLENQACRDLSKILCRPFGSIPNIELPDDPCRLTISMEEICLGLHLHWSEEQWPVRDVDGINKVVLELATESRDGDSTIPMKRYER